MDSQQLVNAIIPILVAIVFSFAAGGATVAAVLVLVLRQISNSPVIIATLKQLYMGLAPEWKAEGPPSRLRHRPPASRKVEQR